MPSVITANDLRSGAVVYLDRSGTWTASLGDAAAISDAGEKARLEAIALASLEQNAVTAVYAFDVKVASGVIEPVSVRERIRAAQSVAAHVAA